jgi:hypothetical protein
VSHNNKYNNNISVPYDIICAHIYTHKSEHGILGPSVSCDIICARISIYIYIYMHTHSVYTSLSTVFSDPLRARSQEASHNVT